MQADLPGAAVRLARDIFAEVADGIDGARLVRAASAGAQDDEPPTAIFAFGKVAFPMFAGACAPNDPGREERIDAAKPDAPVGLIIAPSTRFPTSFTLPPRTRALVSDHPTPTERSLEAAKAALAFVSQLSPADRLLVLLSGGGSAVLAAPAPGLSFADKCAAITAVARAGATIRELNAVRKHLSAVKGGQLALATRASVRVLALSDVIGNDPGTIASGPFSCDDTTYAEALDVLQRLAPKAPPAIRAHLEAGAAGKLPETPKPGDPRLAHVRYTILADPKRVRTLAEVAARTRGLDAQVLLPDTEADVHEVAQRFAAAARATDCARPCVLIGNGEPRITVTGQGRGGRATHLALLMARELSGQTNVAFLAAGTDDRDGSASAQGAVVDGTTWSRARAAGLDPEGALAACDSERPLAALNSLVRGPGTSNLLDLHLLVRFQRRGHNG